MLSSRGCKAGCTLFRLADLKTRRAIAPDTQFAAPRSTWRLRPAAPLVPPNSSNNDVARLADRMIEIAGN